MINIPYEDIVRKIKENAEITDSELQEKIQTKMDQLSGLISKEGAAYIVANDLGVKLVQATGLIKVKDIVAGQRNVETAGVVTKKFEIRNFETNGRAGKVGNFFIADESGQMRVTVWNDQTALMDTFKEGDTLRIVNAMVRANQGAPELSVNDQSKIQVNPSDIKITGVQAVASVSTRKKISELKDSDLAEVFATVVQVYDPRYFEQCPECRKKPNMVNGKYNCEKHGLIDPLYGYVTNIVLDDGTDTVRAVMFKEQMQQLFGKTDSELQAMRGNPEKFEDLKTGLLGEQIIVTGKVVRNEMFDRLELRTSKVQTNVDPEKEINLLKSASEKADNVPEKEIQTASEKIPSIDDI